MGGGSGSSGTNGAVTDPVEACRGLVGEVTRLGDPVVGSGDVFEGVAGRGIADGESGVSLVAGAAAGAVEDEGLVLVEGVRMGAGAAFFSFAAEAAWPAN